MRRIAFEERENARKGAGSVNKPASTKLLDGVFLNSRQAREISEEMDALAHSFAHTGNETVSGLIGTWAFEIARLAELIQALHSDALGAEVRVAEQNSANMLRAVLAGADIATKSG